MKKDQRFYKESGIVEPRILISLPIMGLLTCALSYLYVFLSQINPLIFLNVLLFIGFCFGLGLIAILNNVVSNSRNSLVNTLVGLAIGLVTLYFSWAFFIHRLFQVELLPLLKKPVLLWNDITVVADKGWYSLRSSTVSGIFLWILWGIEAFAIIASPLFFAYFHSSTSVFCEHCKNWAEEDENVVIFTHDNLEQLKQKFLGQSLSFLETAKPVTEETSEYYAIDAEWCKECEGIFTLSLRSISKTWDKKGEMTEEKDTIFEDVLVSQRTHQKVLDAQKTLEPSVTSTENQE